MNAIRSQFFGRRQAMTMVEVLVVLMIIGMLVLVLIPPQRVARDAARRNNCSNQTRQILLACLNRESATQRLPLAMSGLVAADRIDSYGPAPMTSSDGYSFHVPLLPYMEEVALYDAIITASNNLSEPITSQNFEQRNANIFDRPVELLICPSFPGENVVQGRYLPAKPQVSNYQALVAGCAKSGDQQFGDVDPKTGGVLVTKQASADGIQMKDISDGTSTTLIVTESREERWSAWYSGTSISMVAFSPEEASCSNFLDSPESELKDIPVGLNYGSSNESNFYWSSREDKRAWGPSSAHAGDVVMTGFVDGHVKPLSASIGARTYFQMVTRGGGSERELDFD